MKAEDLFCALGEIDDRLVDFAKSGKRHNYKKTAFKWVVGIAACMCLIMTASYAREIIIRNTLKSPPLDINSTIFEPMGLGYEGTDDLSLENSDDINPWTKDASIKELPVYKNLRYNDEKLSQRYYSAEDLEKQTEDFAKYLGLDIIGGEVVEGEEKGEVYNYILQTKQGQVSTNGTGFSFTVKKGYEYLLEKHMAYCCGDKTEVVSGVYRTYSVDDELLDETRRSYYKSGDVIDDIVAFNLQSHYESNSENYISGISHDFISSSVRLGEYPIITWRQAQKKLLKGEYVNSLDESQVAGGKLAEKAIADVDLIYYTNGNPKLYIPYYRFYVNYYSADSDYQRYAYVYVCAVSDRYLITKQSDWSFQ